MDVAAQLGRGLADLGVTQAFALVGSGNFYVTTAFAAAGGTVAVARHESAATTMADAYARTTGTVGVVTLHQGAGLSNAATAITEAAKSRTPLLVVAAQMPADAVGANLYLDQDRLAGAVMADVERVHSARTALDDLHRAYHRARLHRRTVVLNVPIDVQAEPAVDVAPPAAPPAVAHGPADDTDVDALVAALEAAERPVFVAGRGARSDGAREALAELARQTGALLSTSAVARGLFRDDPWSLDVAGGFATPLAQELLPAADLVVAWGAALNDWTTAHGDLLGDHATLAQVDVDMAAFGRHRPVDLALLGDVTATARQVRARLAERERPGWRHPELHERIRRVGRWPRVPFEDRSTVDTIDPRVLSVELEQLLPAERNVAVDSGNFMAYPAMFLSVPDHEAFCFTQGFQAVGLGLATGVGLALARPDRLTVAACGDGGLMFALGELETVARLGLDMLVVVYDDAAYGAEVHHFGPGGDLSTVEFPDLDLAAVARTLGFEAAVATSISDLDPLRRWIDGSRDTPFLLDAKVASFPAWFLEHAFRH